MRRVLCLAVSVGLVAQLLCASTVVYFNQSQWQAAMSTQGTTPLTSVSFASSNWTDQFTASTSFDYLTSQSSTAASNGMAITAVSGYSPIGVANNSLLGHASQGAWTDTISKYGSTSFHFSEPIHGFGGIFDIAGSSGLDIFPGSSPSFASPDGVYDGFIGVVSDQPISSILITWGQNGNCSQCFGNSYALTDFQIGIDPVATPEPNFKYAFAGMLAFAISFCILRRQ